MAKGEAAEVAPIDLLGRQDEHLLLKIFRGFCKPKDGKNDDDDRSSSTDEDFKTITSETIEAPELVDEDDDASVFKKKKYGTRSPAPGTLGTNSYILTKSDPLLSKKSTSKIWMLAVALAIYLIAVVSLHSFPFATIVDPVNNTYLGDSSFEGVEREVVEPTWAIERLEHVTELAGEILAKNAEDGGSESSDHTKAEVEEEKTGVSDTVEEVSAEAVEPEDGDEPDSAENPDLVDAESDNDKLEPMEDQDESETARFVAEENGIDASDQEDESTDSTTEEADNGEGSEASVECISGGNREDASINNKGDTEYYSSYLDEEGTGEIVINDEKSIEKIEEASEESEKGDPESSYPDIWMYAAAGLIALVAGALQVSAKSSIVSAKSVRDANALSRKDRVKLKKKERRRTHKGKKKGFVEVSTY